MAALAVGTTWLLRPARTAINHVNATKITVGMKWDEVVDILGGPPRDESTGPIMADWAAIDARGEVAGSPESAESYARDFRKEENSQWTFRKAWVSNHVIVSVDVVANGLDEPWVRSCDTLPVCLVNESSLMKLYNWLRR
jgi:hypothetical protein